MNARNFEKLMQSQLEGLEGKKKLLLHCCCAPCASACLQRLNDYFDITAFFYNPNIEDGEYSRRRDELIRLLSQTGWGNFSDCGHEKDKFYSAVKGLEREKEGGKRCEVCFSLRLEKTAQTAKDNGFDYFATTLTLSPLKNTALLNEIGEQLAKKYGVSWLYSDFKKKNGYLESIRLSKEYGLYRQNYCGCVYSKA